MTTATDETEQSMPRTVSDDERRARMVMSRVVEPGDVDACALVVAHSARILLERIAARAPSEDESKVSAWADRLRAADEDDIVDQGARHEARYICPGDEEWPHPVADLGHVATGHPDRRGGVPFGLWVSGDASLAELTRRSVAIVGSRSATAYGEHMSGDLALGCAVRDWTVVSGGAYGIDAAAHRGALAANRPTVCVLAGGIDRLYPAGHAPMLRRILERGCLVSEAAPGCAPSKTRFLVRNRLIAAMAAGTVVVEAAVRSGSLNTARWAADLGRHVMGVPGPVTSATSRGVHDLLREEHAVLVTTAEQVVEQVAPMGEALTPRPTALARAVDGLSAQSRRVLDAVPRREPASTESIARTAGLARPVVARRLDWLLASGWVTQTEHDRWVATDQPP